MKFKIAAPVVLVLIFSLCIFWARSSIGLDLIVSSHNYINFQANYQILLLVITGISLATTYYLNKANFLEFFSFGDISAPATEMKLFGTKEGDSWLDAGLSLCLVISSVTAIFMFFQLKQVDVDWSLLPSISLWIILFALTNSIGEEVIFRLGVVSPLKGLLTPKTIFLISALLFGIPHYFGMPSGIIGAVMAGVLGYVMAKSVYETKGIFWAWAIHFLQDVIIIGPLFLISASQNTN